MTKKKKIYEGKAKILYKGPRNNTLIQYFKDDATAFNAKKHEIIQGKGVLNNFISEFIMNGVSSLNIENHFIKRINMREQLIKCCQIIPIEVVLRNSVAGSMSKRFAIAEGTELKRPLIEFYYKNDKLNDPFVNEDHIEYFQWATIEELDEIVSLTHRINDFLISIFYSIDIKLIDFKLEFGRYFDGESNTIILADEISPDNCRLWDKRSKKKLDKDIFREGKGNLIEAYSEIAKRLGVMPKKSNS